MEYQKLTNLLDSGAALKEASNQPFKFRTKNWVEINDELKGVYDNRNIRFKTIMLRSNLCDYADAYILVKGTITITGNEGPEPDPNAPRTAAQLLEARQANEYIDIVMPMYNLIEYTDNCSKTSGGLWQYYKDEPNDNLADSESFKAKVKITGNIPADGNTKDIEIIVPLKYLSNFWRTLEMRLIDCEVNLIITWSKDCVITNSTGAGKFEIEDTRLYVSVVTLSTQDNVKLLQQLKSGFKRTINWNKYQSNLKTHPQNIY